MRRSEAYIHKELNYRKRGKPSTRRPLIIGSSIFGKLQSCHTAAHTRVGPAPGIRRVSVYTRKKQTCPCEFGFRIHPALFRGRSRISSIVERYLSAMSVPSVGIRGLSLSCIVLPLVECGLYFGFHGFICRLTRLVLARLRVGRQEHAAIWLSLKTGKRRKTRRQEKMNIESHATAPPELR